MPPTLGQISPSQDERTATPKTDTHERTQGRAVGQRPDPRCARADDPSSSRPALVQTGTRCNSVPPRLLAVRARRPTAHKQRGRPPMAMVRHPRSTRDGDQDQRQPGRQRSLLPCARKGRRRTTQLNASPASTTRSAPRAPISFLARTLPFRNRDLCLHGRRAAPPGGTERGVTLSWVLESAPATGT